ncbi:hypothetical protein JYT16_00555 [Gemmatimonas aurantiaca]|nr:hypothetical protein [Gemmatimonas aurantiaca]
MSMGELTNVGRALKNNLAVQGIYINLSIATNSEISSDMIYLAVMQLSEERPNGESLFDSEFISGVELNESIGFSSLKKSIGFAFTDQLYELGFDVSGPQDISTTLRHEFGHLMGVALHNTIRGSLMSSGGLIPFGRHDHYMFPGFTTDELQLIFRGP